MRRKNNRLVTEEDWCHLWKARKSSYFFTRNWEKSNKVFSERRMGRWGQIMDIKAHSYIGIHPIFCLSAYFGLIFLTVLPLVDFYLVCWNLTNDGMRQRSYHLLGDVLFQSAAPSELILSISGNLLEGLIRFRPRIKTNDTHVERIFRKKTPEGKLRGNWSQMGHFPLSADSVNGWGSNIGHYLRSRLGFFCKMASHPPKPSWHNKQCKCLSYSWMYSEWVQQQSNGHARMCSWVRLSITKSLAVEIVEMVMVT